MHSPVQIISYYAKPLCYDQHLTYVPASCSVFYHIEYTAKYSVLRALRNTPYPNAVVCSVLGCCGALRGFWLWWVGVVDRWLGTISTEEKQKRLRENPWEKGWMSPETLKKRIPPHKKDRKKHVGFIDSPAVDDAPGVSPNFVVPVGIQKDLQSCAWY